MHTPRLFVVHHGRRIGDLNPCDEEGRFLVLQHIKTGQQVFDKQVIEICLIEVREGHRLHVLVGCMQYLGLVIRFNRDVGCIDVQNLFDGGVLHHHLLLCLSQLCIPGAIHRFLFRGVGRGGLLLYFRQDLFGHFLVIGQNLGGIVSNLIFHPFGFGHIGILLREFFFREFLCWYIFFIDDQRLIRGTADGLEELCCLLIQRMVDNVGMQN